jgi:DHA2 family multidrug resistance protein
VSAAAAFPPGTAAPAAAAEPPRLNRQALAGLATALAGSLLVSLSGQSVASTLADIQGAVGASADEGSWLDTAYMMGSFCGIVCSTPLIGAFGLGRYMSAGAILFALSGLACAAAPDLPLLVASRALQGFAGGGFGPAAFVATFMTMRGPRLPFGLAILALVLLLPATFAPVLSGFLEERFGWQAPFLVQAMVGSMVAVAAVLLLPRGPIAREALKRDWAALLLLATALAASLLVLGQGTRRYWLDSDLIAWSLAIAAGGWTGFLATLARSPMPAIDVALLGRPAFAGPILLNLLFRAGFAVTAFLIPQFLVVAQGYRPLELARLFLWAGIPQLLIFPPTFLLLQRIDGRWVCAAGLLLFGLGALLAADSTSLAAADQFKIPLMLAGVGQVLFLVPNLVAGGKALTPADGPTASLMFNATTLGGTSLGVAMATELVTERQKFHVGALAESAAAYGSRLDRLEDLATLFALRASDDLTAASRAVAAVAGALRREAWILSFNDGFLLVALLLLASAAGLLLLPPQRPLGGGPTSSSGELQ